MADRARPAVALTLALGLLAAAPRADADPVFPVVDLHVDLPWQVHLKKRGDTLEKGHVTVASLARGNVAGIVLPLYLPDDLHADGPHPADLEAMYRAVEKLVWTASLPFAPLPEGKPPRVRTWLAMEGAQALAEDTASTGSWVKRGIRLVGLAHGHDNALAGSSTGAKRAGLTEKGRDVAKRALAAGALLDVSHLSDAAFDDALALSREAGAPLVASHSDARAVANHPRNLTDAQLRALGATGGVVGVNFHRPYVTTKPSASLADVVAQLDHLVAEAGEDHVAIGSDYDGGIAPPASLPDAGHFPALARALLDHGWPEARVRKVFSENALRVLDR